MKNNKFNYLKLMTNKGFYASLLFLALLVPNSSWISKNEEIMIGYLENEKKDGKQEENEIFNIFHKHDFENNTLGDYNKEEKNQDWNIVYDNRPNHPEIVNLDGNKRGRNLYEEGKFAQQTGSDFGGSLNEIPNEIYFTYQIFFEPGFDWGRAVKFPGLQMYPTMGAGNGLNPGNGGSTIRFQSDKDGKLRWYVYHHKMKTLYGENLDWDGFQLLTGQWYTITLRVVLNTPGESNGVLQVFVNDQLHNSQNNMMFRTKTSVQNINRQSLSTFMGGGDSSFAPSKDQYSWIDNFFIWNYSDSYLQSNPTLARGRILHSGSNNLITPLTKVANSKYNLMYGAYPPNAGKVLINK